jgi:peptidoglycan/xylan/chitin deacetylase (PgdA/CDA1 family)/glycosyltransferase involved in cell wall biosynthesis
VVIPTRDRARILARTLPTVLDQSLDPSDYEVVVVVDGQDPATVDVARSVSSDSRIAVVEQPPRGLASARNLGVREANGRWILFLDDDLVCERELLNEHVTAHERLHEVGVVHGAIFASPESPPTLAALMTSEWYEQYNRQLLANGGLDWPRDVFFAGNSSLSREAVIAAGGFDERFRFPGYEFGYRLWKRGFAFEYQPSAVAHEIFIKPTRDFIHDARGLGASEPLMCRKHPEYKPYSLLATVGDGSVWKRALRATVLRPSLPLEAILVLPIIAAERLIRLAPMRRAGIRLLALRHRLVLLRAGLRSCGAWSALQADFGRRLPVLLYHRVAGSAGMRHRELTVSPQAFERHMQWLARRGFRGITASDWIAWCTGTHSLPRKPVLLTFDDGYADLVEHAFPVLERHGFSANVFVVSAEMGGHASWQVDPELARQRLLSSEQLRHLAGQGIEVGAHGRTHANLARADDGELRTEIELGTAELENAVGHSIFAFAYPYGAFDERAQRLVRQLFRCAFTTNGRVNTLRTDPHLMSRTMVQPGDSVLELELRLRLGRNPIERARATLRIRSRLKSLAAKQQRTRQRIAKRS